MPDPSIAIVDAHALGARMNWLGAFQQSEESRAKSLSDWKMEIDDAPILAYIYSQAAPRRHFEFGTWQGFGALLCAQSCDARIWTVNLPEGEVLNGRPAYTQTRENAPSDLSGARVIEEGGAAYVQTDCGPFIGRLYREAGYGDRVEQLLADSTQMDMNLFEAGFFDTILIDGGHTRDVVAADTARALRWTRAGGLILWHDFCPDPDVIRHSGAARGVAQAVSAHVEDWRAQLRDLFWIRKSHILMGVKA